MKLDLTICRCCDSCLETSCAVILFICFLEQKLCLCLRVGGRIREVRKINYSLFVCLENKLCPSPSVRGWVGGGGAKGGQKRPAAPQTSKPQEARVGSVLSDAPICRRQRNIDPCHPSKWHPAPSSTIRPASVIDGQAG